MIEYKTLGCGVGLVTQYEPDAQMACLGVFVGAGNCRETAENSGVSHFIEHMFFKGTNTRNALQLAQAADDLGAAINAYTGKEETVYYIKALTGLFPQASELLLDMLCNSVFDPAEIRREKGVVLEEMMMAEDTPDDIIIDHLTDRVYYGTSLQRPVLGTRSSLRRLDRGTILEYINTYYAKDNIVVAAVGNFDENRLVSQLDEYLDGLAEKSPQRGEIRPSGVKRFRDISRDVSQSHIALGIPTVSVGSPDYYAQSIVLDVFGGSMSSRLFQTLREKLGLCYSVYSSPESFTDSGMIYIYSDVTQGKEKEAVDAIAGELEELADKGISEEQIELVKRRLKSGYIFSLERINGRMHVLGKNRLLLGRNYTPEENMAEIDAITPRQVSDYIAMIADIHRYSAVSISKEKLDIRKLIG
ncbi:MAG: insulinase family protein [Firmicutes bacterium]|nr:insulinase family protein [Bacillota bacterium]